MSYYKLGGGFLILAISLGGLIKLSRKLPSIQKTLFAYSSEEEKAKAIDRLSELPQEIIDIILSKFIHQHNIVPCEPCPPCRIVNIRAQLSTKTSIENTSILSKRWRYAWTTCPTLKFLTKDFSSIECFIKFVNTTLEIRGKHPITTFEVYWTLSPVDVSCLSAWLHYAVLCGVQEIVLQVYNLHELKLPPSLLRCHTLKAFDLISPLALLKPWKVRCFLQLPNSARLENLRSLDLQYVTCSNGSLEELISRCTFLESLKLGTCHESMQITAPNLKSLYLYCTKGSVQIYAPRLESLACKLKSPGEISSEDFKFLVNAYVGYYHKPKGNVKKLAKLLQRLSNVKVLTLDLDVIESLSELDLTEQIFPLFDNLKYLNIYPSLAPKNISVIIMLVRRCPCLEKLVLHRYWTLPIGFIRRLQVPWQ